MAQESSPAHKILSFDVGIKNLSFCYLQASALNTKVIDWNILCVTEDNVTKIKIEQLTELILQCLMENFDSHMEVDTVLIENQPMLKNGMMKTIAVVIYTYFNMLKLQYGNIQEVRFISATNKLKCKGAEGVVADTQKKSSYKDRKMASIALVDKYKCVFSEEKLTWFKSLKKQDDAADSLLQGIYFIESVRKIKII